VPRVSERIERICEQGLSTDGSGYSLAVVESVAKQPDGSVTVANSDLGGAASVVEVHAPERNQ
jgi:sensor histidine kinase regulating citrate/malate metabolism